MLCVAMSFAFFGMLRVSEYTLARSVKFSPNSTLLCQDVSLVGDCIHIYIKASKTDPFRSGVTIRVARSRGRCCPVRAFVHYRSLRRFWSGPLCSFADGSFLTRSRLSLILNLCLHQSNVSTHSFRIGGASAAAAVGVPDSSI